MHKNYYELQKRCKRYYLKIYLRYLLIGVLVAVMVTSVAIYFKNEQSSQSVQAQPKTPQKKAAVTATTEPKTQPKQSDVATEVQTKSEKPVQTPVAPTQNSGESNQTKPQQKKELTPVYNFEIDTLYEKQLQRSKAQSQSAQVAKTEQEQRESPAPTTETAQPQPSKKVVIESVTLQNVEDKITLFNQRPHFEHAYTIAKDYFDKKEYENAIKWCKEADALKSAQEKVFELYALSLVKLQRYNEAVSLLNYYLGMKVSNRLESLKYAIEQKKL